MKIAYVVETYTEGLGYIDNILPREISKLGNEVHVLTCGLPPYYMTNSSHFGELKSNGKRKDLVQEADGILIHWQSYKLIGKRAVMNDLRRKLIEISPDIVIVRGISSFVLAQVVFAKLFCSFSIFTSTGQSYSSMSLSLREGPKISLARLKNLFTRKIPGRLLSFFINTCIGSTKDCVDCVVDFYGVPREKTETISLGVDTDLFYPVNNQKSYEERSLTRAQLKIGLDDILCIWTGRLTSAKLPGLLAKAVEELRSEGYKYRALFIGAGPEEDAVKSYPNSTLLPFMQWSELPRYYRAADIAVWPCLITTSTLDASACGLPVIMSNQEKASERWEGIGLTYVEGDLQSLKEKLLDLADNEYRNKLGNCASLKIKDLYSWEIITKQFVELFVK